MAGIQMADHNIALSEPLLQGAANSPCALRCSTMAFCVLAAVSWVTCTRARGVQSVAVLDEEQKETPYCKSGRCLPGVVTQLAHEELAAELADNSTPLLLDVFATWCGPCKEMAPVLEALAKTMQHRVRIVKVDVDIDPNITEELLVPKLPSLILFKDGSEKRRAIGKMKEMEIIDWMSSAGVCRPESAGLFDCDDDDF
eukprot:gnl/TRDRNA2_/TRDRNA2_132642_c0_seq1.p1 gnl/TRDRNA2_/TRDRNA2_132642_c0~~gnl/TRDRNA2_/TRDRNA2_132642_c0_seq1.p1  ORF type:complete len:199 (-),score=39.82 gnl/TRDRNA2_/TRDRNA2_132642_c0_seq1:572-1168(-)